MSQQGCGSRWHVRAPLPHRIKIYYKARKEKKIYKQPFSIPTLFPSNLWKRGRREKIFSGVAMHPQFLATGKLSIAPKVLLTVCHEKMCWETSPIWKSIKRQERQKARKEMESHHLSKGWVNIQSKSSLLSVPKANALSFLPGNLSVWLHCLSPPALQAKNCPVAAHFSRFWWVSGPRGRCRTTQSLWAKEQYTAHSAQGVTSTSLSRKGGSQIPSQELHSKVFHRPAGGKGKRIMDSF